MPNTKLNNAVTQFLDNQQHPFRKEIEQLRILVLNANSHLTENIKWNGPNYSFYNNDRITMRIHPPKQVQLIFHRGAKVQSQPAERIIKDESRLLAWKENDRAVLTFKSRADIEKNASALEKIINDWLLATP